jgi:hypothetical protein
MNERIRQLAEQAEQYADDTINSDPAKYDKPGQVKVWRELMQAKFAELIVAECNKISKETCDELKADESIQTPGSKINWNLYNGTLRNKLAEHFWVDLL